MKRKKTRIFIGLIEIAGYYCNLLHGLEQLGCKVRMVNLVKHPFGYEEPSSGWIGGLIKWHFQRALGYTTWPRWMPAWLRGLIGTTTVRLAALRYDVFVFSYGLSFADDKNGPGLAPLHARGRKVVFIFNGSDSRATYCDRTGFFIGGNQIDASTLLKLTREKQEKLRWVHEVADLVVDYPLSGHFHTGKYVDFIRLGIPTVLLPPESLPPPPGSGVPGRAIRILHCPSETGIKGSAEIRRVIDHLKSAGWQLDFLELHGVSNARVMEELKRCDIVVDQLFGDTPMAGFAREAAQFARPVIMGGYAWGELLPHIPDEEWPRSLTCHPDKLEECLLDLLTRGPLYWKRVGMIGYNFVNSRWDARQCASRLLQAIYEPDKCSLWVEPQSCGYIWGNGMHALEIIELAQTIMRTAGPEGFCIADKPELLALTVALGTIPLMDSPPSAIPELPPITDETWTVARTLIERNVILSTKNREMEAEIARLRAIQDEYEQVKSIASFEGSKGGSTRDHVVEAQAKIKNFRGMIQRRDQRIEKLEKKLGIQKTAGRNASDQLEK